MATLLVWSVALDAVAYRSPRLGALLKARPRPLVENGEVNHHTVRRELLSQTELHSQLRLHGVEHISEVERAYLEPNGMISVFKRDSRDEQPDETPPAMT